MEHQAVESDMLRSIGYDPATQVMEVVFAKNGAVYQYPGVSADLHADFMAAKSKGAFFQKEIRGRVSRKVEGAAPVATKPKAEPTPQPQAEKATEVPPRALVLANGSIPALNHDELTVQLDTMGKDSAGIKERLEALFAPLRAMLEPSKRATLMALSITTNEDYEVVAAIGTMIADYRRGIEKFMKPVKQALKEPGETARTIEVEFLEFLKPVEDHFSKIVTAWRVQVQRARDAEAKRIQDEQRQKLEESRLTQAVKAEASGNTKLADALINAPIAVKPVSEKVLPQAAPKVEGVTKHVNWNYRVTDLNLVPREYLILDAQKVGKFVRDNKEKAKGVIPGIEVYSEEDTRF